MSGVGSSDQEYWRMIRPCAGGHAQDKSVFNRMMLRFRPIAPKPATCPDVSGGLSSDNNNKSNNLTILPKGRRKRNYVRVRKYTRRKPTSVKPRNESFDHHDHSSTTLQLLPERSDLNRPIEIDLSNGGSSSVVKESCYLQENRGLPTCWISDKRESEGTRMSDRVFVVQSWVTVECVTGTCIDNGQLQAGLGCTDVERVMNLERDTCPGFVSDGSNSVMWVNGAFKGMVTARRNDGPSPEPEVVVGLEIKESFPSLYSAFTGHVKLQYGMGMERYSRIVPCDLWRMDGGGFAWRLDVEAALTLGR
ncbi:hypothetical protein L484_017647 [Morus notabilis]|uniref:DUF7950 domain-containing protein n=1 Tax=Morus notabilis TaxID=981085 RepID=W9SWV1_9ROSA|nr:uncharacterized protein LOC21400636 isoform X2 [Morus notabilis]XP_024031323.1 uncharacterized protein LOC21400636 isoform X2 [Morus notabilis]XP_024031324.1 uncharacterized protein LOC21400636 isoform X2 [Morus notabilis]EXC31366.1 hypothetical protein L484_017647 [Morus notabilis]